MYRGAWPTTVHGGHIESDMTEQLTHIDMESRKTGADEPICRAVMEMQTQRTYSGTRVEGRKERVGDMERVTWKYRIPYENRYPVGICGMTQETQTGAL